MMNAPLSVSRGALVAGAFCGWVAGCPGAPGCCWAGCGGGVGSGGVITMRGKRPRRKSTALKERTVKTNRRSNKPRMKFFPESGYCSLDDFSLRECCNAKFSVSVSSDFFFSHFHTPNGPWRSNFTMSPSSVALMPAADTASGVFSSVVASFSSSLATPNGGLAVDPLLTLRVRVMVIAVRSLGSARGDRQRLGAVHSRLRRSGLLLTLGGPSPAARRRKLQLRKTVS